MQSGVRAKTERLARSLMTRRYQDNTGTARRCLSDRLRAKRVQPAAPRFSQKYERRTLAAHQHSESSNQSTTSKQRTTGRGRYHGRARSWEAEQRRVGVAVCAAARQRARSSFILRIEVSVYEEIMGLK
eukprot:2610406-Prymnesium_polylepis.1